MVRKSRRSLASIKHGGPTRWTGSAKKENEDLHAPDNEIIAADDMEEDLDDDVFVDDDSTIDIDNHDSHPAQSQLRNETLFQIISAREEAVKEREKAVAAREAEVEERMERLDELERELGKWKEEIVSKEILSMREREAVAQAEKMKNQVAALRATSKEKSHTLHNVKRREERLLQNDKERSVKASKLSPEHDVALCELLGMGKKRRERVKQFLRKLDNDVFSSTKQYLQARASLDSSSAFDFKCIDIPLSKGSDVMKKVNILYHSDIMGAITLRVQDKAKAGSLVTVKHGEAHIVRIGWTGDKGGTTTKIAVAVLDDKRGASVNELILAAFYDHGDSHDTLASCLPELWSSLSQVHGHSVDVSTPAGSFIVQLHLILCADLKFSYSIIGHSGANAKYYCPICTTAKIPSVSQWTPCTANHSLYRSPAVLDPSVSISNTPILPIDGSCIVVPGLHVILGLITKAHNALKSHIIAEISNSAVQLFEDELQETLLELESNIAKQKTIEEGATNCNLMRAQASRLSKRKKAATACSSPVCLRFHQSRQSIPAGLHPWERIQCSSCSDRVHRACEAIHVVGELGEFYASAYKCAVCVALPSLQLGHLEEELVREASDEIRALSAERAALLSTHTTSIKDKVDDESRKAISLLHSKEKELGINNKTYYSSFVGRDVQILAKHAETLWGFIKNQPVYLADRLEGLTHDIRGLFVSLNPNETVTPKLHLLEHAVEHLRTHGHLAVFQDGVIEQLHQLFNSYDRRFCPIVCPEDRMRAIAKAHGYRNIFHTML